MYNQTLPFSLSQFQQTYFISGLPHSNNIIPTIYPTEPGISMTRLAAGYYRQQLQDNAGKNVLRCFNYNRCSQNNFCNDDFTIGVKKVVDYAIALFQSGQIPNPEQAAAQAAAVIAQLDCGTVLQLFPQVAAQCAPDVVQSLASSPAATAQIQQLIAMYSGRPQQPVQNQWAAQATTVQPVGQYSQYGAHPNNINNGWAATNAPSVFDAQPPRHHTGGPVESSYAAAYAAGREETTEEVEVYHEAVVEPVVTATAPETYEPSDAQPHHLAYCPISHRNDYEVIGGALVQVLTHHKNKEAFVDYLKMELEPTVLDEALRAAAIRNEAPKRVDNWERFEEITHAVETPDELITPDYSKDVHVVDRVSGSLAEAIIAIDAVAKDDVIVESVFTDTTILTGNHEVEALYENIAACFWDEAATYSDLIAVINEHSSSLTTLQHVNMRRRMTEVMRWILRLPMGLPKVKFDDFLTDYGDLSKLILNKYGEKLHTSFEDTVRYFVCRTFGHTHGAAAEHLPERFTMSSPVALARVPWTSGEMWLEIDYNGSAVMPSLLPELHSALLAFLRRAEASCNSKCTRIQDTKFRRYLVQTKDRAVFEVSRGALGSDALFISCAKL